MQFFQKKELQEDNCCSSQPKGKLTCPSCGEKAKGVLSKTLDALLNKDTKEHLDCLDGFYYCKTPKCKTIYFRENFTLSQKDIGVIVGIKEDANPATVCYCFEWTKEKIKEELLNTGKTIALEDIKTKMKDPGCACEVLNPSGGCCLGDTSKAIKEIQKELNDGRNKTQ